MCGSLLLATTIAFSQGPASFVGHSSQNLTAAKAVIELQLADGFTRHIESDIARLKDFEQPVAWASLYAVWHESGRRADLLKLRNDGSHAAYGLDHDMECSRIDDPWLRKALDGLAPPRKQLVMQRRQYVVSAAYVLRFLAPFGKGITACVIAQMQSKIVKKNDYAESWPSLTPEEREIMRPIASDLGHVAEDLATNDDSFDRAEQLAHTIIKLRSAAPLAGFLQNARENHPEKADEVIQEALDSLDFDADAEFTAELGELLLPSIQQSAGYALDPFQRMYLATMPAVLKKAFDPKGNVVALANGLGAVKSGDRIILSEKCDLASEAQRLSGFINANYTDTIRNAVTLCNQTAKADAQSLLGHELRTSADYLAAARVTGDPARRADYRLSAAKLAVQDDPLSAVDIMNGASTDERLEYPAWRQQVKNVDVAAARRLHQLGDSQHLAQLVDHLPDRMRASVQVGLAADSITRSEEHSFTEFMLRSAYRTLERFGTDDPETLVQFANVFARALPMDGAGAFADTMKWMNDVPHPADPWRDSIKARLERNASPEIRDAPPPLGREFKPAPLDESILQVPNLSVSAVEGVRDLSDRISLYLGLTRATIKQEKKTTKPPAVPAAEKPTQSS